MSWYLMVIKNYAGFSGRARRKEYWMFYLMNCIIVVALAILLSILTVITGAMGFMAIYYLYALFIFLPALAVTIRRLHDIGKSGWWYLIVFIPLIGVIWLIVLLATEGNAGENQYGPDPKAQQV